MTQTAFRKTAGLAMAGAMITGAAVHAETLKIEGHLPAASDAGVEHQIIAIDDLNGAQGAKLGFELKTALERIRVDGDLWFDVAAFGSPGVEAVIQGSGDLQSSVTDVDPKQVRTCETKDAEENCIKYKTTAYDCSRYEMSFFPDIELVARSGEVLYSARDTLKSSTLYCTDEAERPSHGAMANVLIQQFSDRVRDELAPRYLRADYRVLERRKGLSEPDRDAFKQALRLTKSNEDAACDAFRALDEKYPRQASVVFNVALCFERAGEYGMARETYQRALNAEPNKPMTLEAMARVDNWERGEDQLNRRAAFLAAANSAPPAQFPPPQTFPPQTFPPQTPPTQPVQPAEPSQPGESFRPQTIERPGQ
ncbi:hypothetical protein FGU71_00070 [Erythrobacter insulae]|uniref:Uncharacterized protein n=1 Tax=Erythrobacter insulae TaxID=2584124 RepID=A0A547P8J4_9SPHN|nr:hypothetical protein [Erythrobacter insulae]TRD10423.1 hypothetical protein FGU71_00070 [Erythrobacter insulae]